MSLEDEIFFFFFFFLKHKFFITLYFFFFFFFSKASIIENFKLYLFIHLFITWILLFKKHKINKKINIICSIRTQ